MLCLIFWIKPSQFWFHNISAWGGVKMIKVAVEQGIEDFAWRLQRVCRPLQVDPGPVLSNQGQVRLGTVLWKKG